MIQFNYGTEPLKLGIYNHVLGSLDNSGSNAHRMQTIHHFPGLTMGCPGCYPFVDFIVVLQTIG